MDTGPDEAYPALKARLAKLPADTHGNRHIDLFVATHIDRFEALGFGQAADVAARVQSDPSRG